MGIVLNADFKVTRTESYITKRGEFKVALQSETGLLALTLDEASKVLSALSDAVISARAGRAEVFEVGE